MDSTPGGVAARDIDRLIRSGDQRFGIPKEEDLINIEMSRLKGWLDPSLETSAIEIGIVGDFDRDTIIAEVARTFGALPRRPKTHKRSDVKLRELKFPEGVIRPIKLAHAGQPDTAMLRTYWPAPDGQDVQMARHMGICLLYTSPSPRDRTRSRMPSSA